MERLNLPDTETDSVPREYRSLMGFMLLLVFISGFPQLYYAAAMMIAVTLHYFRNGGTPDAFVDIGLPWLERHSEVSDATQHPSFLAEY